MNFLVGIIDKNSIVQDIRFVKTHDDVDNTRSSKTPHVVVIAHVQIKV